MKAIRSVMKSQKEGKSSSSSKKKKEKTTSSKSAADPPGERVEYIRNADGKLVKRTTRMRKKGSKKSSKETSSVKTLSSASTTTVPSYIDDPDCSETSVMSDFSSSAADKDPIYITECPPGTTTNRSKSLITPAAVKELNNSSHALLDSEIAKHKAVLAKRMDSKNSLQAPASPKRNFTVQKRSTSSVADVNPFETTNFGSGHYPSYSLGSNDPPSSPKSTFTRDSSTHSWVRREATQAHLLEADDDEDESFAAESMYSAQNDAAVFSYNPPAVTRPMLEVQPESWQTKSLKAVPTTYKSSSVSAVRTKSFPNLQLRDSLKLSFIQQGDKGMLSFSQGAKKALDNCVDVQALELPSFDTPHALLARPVFYNKICGPVVMIQAMIRGFLQYRRYLTLRDQMESMVAEWATTTVQAAARRWMAMALVEQTRKQSKAIVPLQAMVRRGLVRKNTRVPLLELRLRNIQKLHKEELKAIEKSRRKKEKKIRSQLESKAQHKDEKQSVGYHETQDEILKLKEENKILRHENAQLMEDTKAMALQNRQAIETLEQTQLMIKQLQKDIPGLERDQEKLADVEKQFADRLKQYREAYVEGAELVAGEEGIKTIYWKSIVEICHHVKKESLNGGKRSNPELPSRLKAITQEILKRDATDDAWMESM